MRTTGLGGNGSGNRLNWLPGSAVKASRFAPGAGGVLVGPEEFRAEGLEFGRVGHDLGEADDLGPRCAGVVGDDDDGVPGGLGRGGGSRGPVLGPTFGGFAGPKGGGERDGGDQSRDGETFHRGFLAPSIA